MKVFQVTPNLNLCKFQVLTLTLILIQYRLSSTFGETDEPPIC